MEILQLKSKVTQRGGGESHKEINSLFELAEKRIKKQRQINRGYTI